jgi:HSP20 family protein
MRYRRTGTRYVGVFSMGGRPTTFDLLLQRTPYVVVPSVWRPAADVAESEDAITVLVELAGVDEDDMEIVLHDDALVIEGHRHADGVERDAVYHAVEIRQGEFRLEVPLPASIVDDDVDATLERGLLRVRLPKRTRRTITPTTPDANHAADHERQRSS